MTRANRTKLAMLLIVIGFFGSDGVQADPLAPPSHKDSEWRVDFSPYIFLPASITGDSTVAGQSVSLDFDTGDLLDLLSFALSGRLEIWKGDFGVILDGMYIKVDAGGTADTPGPLPIGASIDADIQQFYMDGLGSYRLINQPYDADGNLWSLVMTRFP